MKRKIVGLFVCMLMITIVIPLTAMAGDENEPEISDTTGDARTNVDIQKAWFFEDPVTPEYLYITLKVTYLETKYRGTLLHDVYWKMNNINYFVYAGLGLYMSNEIGTANFITGHPWKIKYANITGSLDVKNNTITHIIPKFLIGNPQKGDILTKTHATTSQRTPFMQKLGWDAFLIDQINRILGSLSKCWMDIAPDDKLGRNYIIQY